MKKEIINKLIKTLLVFICYIFYTQIITSILSIIKITDPVSTMFISDLIFLISIIILYHKNLKEDLLDFKNNYSWKEKITVVIKGILVIFILNIIMGMLTEFLFPSIANVKDENASIIGSLFEVSTFYTLFKTLIFAIVAEELLFRESIHECVQNKLIFLLVSASIYTLMNVIFIGFESNGIWMDIIAYLLNYLVLSFIYLKYNDNIVIIMIIKFFYNLIPTILLFIGAFQ